MIEINDYPALSSVVKFFEEISAVPRPSGHTREIADYLVRFAEERNLEYIRDSADNVIIKKNGASGKSGRPTVILQGHTDMVAVCAEGTERNLKTEGVEPYRDGDFIKAKGTTLGADDGVAVAYALAILDSNDIIHPNIECLFTSNEEIGLLGASALDPKSLKGRIMINLDSDDEGVFTVGCAGGKRLDLSFRCLWEAAVGNCYYLCVSGLAGGHSGIEIDKGHLNAIKIAGEVLSSFENVMLDDISGGEADNAIPKSCSARFYTTSSYEHLGRVAEKIQSGYSSEEPNIKIEIREAPGRSTALASKQVSDILSVIEKARYGVIKMSNDVPGLVETSQNIGIIELSEERLRLTFSVRSSYEDSKNAIADETKMLGEQAGAQIKESGNYPGWDYRKDSPIRELSVKVFEEVYGKSPEIMLIHAGLECGVIIDKIPELDCISFAPDSKDIHTPRERLSISSTARVYEFLKTLLGRI